MKAIYQCLVLAGLFVAPANTTAQSPKKFIDKSNMNLKVKAGDDFVEYANGTWVKNNPIPAKETRWGSFNQLRDFNIQAVKDILEEARANQKSYPVGSIERRVADFYAAAMDSVAIEKMGYTPIKPDLDKVNTISSKKEVLDALAQFRISGMGSPLFSFGVGQDRKNVEKMVPQLYQGGTTLPDRDYYLKSDARSTKIQEAYKNYIKTLFELVGNSSEQANAHATTVFALEKKLAQAQMSRVEMRDPYKTYNKFAWNEFQQKTTEIDWSTLFQQMNVPKQDSILVSAPKFFEDVNQILKETSIPEWKSYLQWNILKGSATHLSSPFVKASFSFNQLLSGQKVQTPRWQRMASLTDGTIGELLGQLYVRKYFKPEAKERMNELIENLRKAFEIRIQKLDWMSEATKKKAMDKLHAFRPKVGYPDVWRTYEGLEISGDQYFQNIRNAGAWGFKENVSQVGKKVDRNRWGMTPPTVNAYYSPVMNEIVFPAGILQFPFFDPKADDAINYGGIGAVIGHEMSHGFDDSGSKYDKDGTLRNWWTDEDLNKFKAKTALLGAQFDGYKILDTIRVNGKLTMGENIGDLGGLNMAYEAFKMTKQGQSKKKIDGFTPDQRFFLSWAQVWRGSTLPETAAQLIITDPHSPNEFRTIGAPVNMDAWYEAFNVKPGDKLYKKPEDRIKIW
ncbi:M13 family metallopeptidase [Aquirufa rosea]|uniref:M13 family peptidase n=1 Tax=Aquirufa rosea TaxID=2509241 RepID=A0A4Q1C0E4_9BACT|nr:M13 family metallopeptidase [Aquirufa rosea]RXK49849.1 M13 family peptidase [Aquirufa rosea]